MDKSVKLHLGCGDTLIKGFINVDVLNVPAVDIIYDLKNLNCFKDEIADVIYASHFLEHFSTDEIPVLLQEMHRVLKPNGELRLSVPDLDKICKLYVVENIDWFTLPHNLWLGLFYGSQRNRYNFHKTGFNFRWLKFLLECAGFVRIEEVDYFEDHGILSGSFANKPFGKISLNCRACKGSIVENFSFRQYSMIEKLLTIIETITKSPNQNYSIFLFQIST